MAGLIPIGDLLKGATKVIAAGTTIFAAFKVVKALSKISGNIYTKLIDLAQQGWKVVWDDGLKKMTFKNGDEVVGSLSSKTENIIDPLDSSFPDGNFEVPTTTISKAEGWALKKADDIAQSEGTVPSGVNQKYIGSKNIAKYGHRIKADHPASIKNQVDEIVQNGDNGPQPIPGAKTEGLANDVLEKIYPEGTVHSNVHYEGNKGFDNVVVMPDASVIINDAKQISAKGSMVLGEGFNSVQLSDDWIDGVKNAMKTSTNPNAAALYETIDTAPSIIKIITAVDKSTGEIIITKINSF